MRPSPIDWTNVHDYLNDVLDRATIGQRHPRMGEIIEALRNPRPIATEEEDLELAVQFVAVEDNAEDLAVMLGSDLLLPGLLGNQMQRLQRSRDRYHELAERRGTRGQTPIPPPMDFSPESE